VSCEWLLWPCDCRKAARLEDDEYKTTNQTYYNIAHSSSERVIEQPSLLVGGTLKEYQVCMFIMTSSGNVAEVVLHIKRWYETVSHLVCDR